MWFIIMSLVNLCWWLLDWVRRVAFRLCGPWGHCRICICLADQGWWRYFWRCFCRLRFPCRWCTAVRLRLLVVGWSLNWLEPLHLWCLFPVPPKIVVVSLLTESFKLVVRTLWYICFAQIPEYPLKFIVILRLFFIFFINKNNI